MIDDISQTIWVVWIAILSSWEKERGILNSIKKPESLNLQLIFS